MKKLRFFGTDLWEREGGGVAQRRLPAVAVGSLLLLQKLCLCLQNFLAPSPHQYITQFRSGKGILSMKKTVGGGGI